MTKIEAVMKLYQSVYPHVELEQAGTWIRVYPGNGDPASSYRANDLIEEIYTETGTWYEWCPWDKQLKIIHYNKNGRITDQNDCWSSGDNWNTEKSIMPQVATNGMYDNLLDKEEPDNIFDDIGEI